MKHLCYEMRPDAGTIQPDICGACREIQQFPCEWCGFGAVFTTHNSLAHSDNGDPQGWHEDEWTDEMYDQPYRDWRTLFAMRT